MALIVAQNPKTCPVFVAGCGKISHRFPVMTNLPRPLEQNTLYGILAILLWSTTIAFSRSVIEALGTLTATFWIYTLAGLAGFAVLALKPGRLRAMVKLPRLYLFGCGALFVIYTAALEIAVGLAASREQVLAVGLLNYLWPGFSLLFSVPILKQRASPLLAVGVIIALVGVWLATTGGVNPLLLLNDPRALVPYCLALLAAVCWGLYTNLSRRWAADDDGGAVPLFLLASGLAVGAALYWFPETSRWSPSTVFELVYMALLPGMLAYVLWDIAVRKGNIILVASLSYLTPLLSTLFSALLLAVRPSGGVWIGAVLLIAGAWLCERSIHRPNQTAR